jgi:microcompartment protein CcmL/EutN
MKTFDSDLLIVETSDAPSGYVALDILCREESIRILEASVAGAGHFVILAQGAKVKLREAAAVVHTRFDGSHPERLVDSEVITGPSQDLLDSVYALNEVHLEETLVVVSCETVSALMSVAAEAIQAADLKLIETRIYRSGRCGGLALITGSSPACIRLAEEARARLKSAQRKSVIEVIDKPTANFRTFFNISGEA